jgi:ABC-type multidrug transport system ATPase subunit
LVDRFGHVQARFDELGGYALEARAREIMAGLGFTQEQMDGDVGNLSGGWKMRVALARILLMRPNVMLLDEPSNHLDIESIIWLEGFLKDYDGALLMTTHDREFMNRVVNKIIEIDGGVLTSYSGNYDFYEKQRALHETVQAEAAYARQQAMLAKEIRFIERFKAQASHAAQVQSRVKKLDKIEKLEPPRRRRSITFEFPESPRSGEDVVKIEGLCKHYGSHVIYDDFSLMIRRKERWSVMGVNGAGKSTLLKLVAGEIQADAGKVTLGAGVRMGYFAQHAMELLDPQKTVYETLEDAFPLASVGTLKSLGGCFGFSGSDIDKVCRVLSGGEKGPRGHGALALRPAQPAGPRRADQPPRSGHQGNAADRAARFRGHHALRVARPALSLAGPVQSRAGAGPWQHHHLRRRVPGIRCPQRPRGPRPARQIVDAGSARGNAKVGPLHGDRCAGCAAIEQGNRSRVGSRHLLRPHLQVRPRRGHHTTLLAERVLIDGDDLLVGERGLGRRAHLGQVVSRDERCRHDGPHAEMGAAFRVAEAIADLQHVGIVPVSWPCTDILGLVLVDEPNDIGPLLPRCRTRCATCSRSKPGRSSSYSGRNRDLGQPD